MDGMSKPEPTNTEGVQCAHMFELNPIKPQHSQDGHRHRCCCRYSVGCYLVVHAVTPDRFAANWISELSASDSPAMPYPSVGMIEKTKLFNQRREPELGRPCVDKRSWSRPESAV